MRWFLVALCAQWSCLVTLLSFWCDTIILTHHFSVLCEFTVVWCFYVVWFFFRFVTRVRSWLARECKNDLGFVCFQLSRFILLYYSQHPLLMWHLMSWQFQYYKWNRCLLQKCNVIQMKLLLFVGIFNICFIGNSVCK